MGSGGSGVGLNAGVGAELTVPLGGKVDNQHGDTLEVSAKVLRLSDGQFVFGGAMRRGSVTLWETRLYWRLRAFVWW